jgi:hypothetical protein
MKRCKAAKSSLAHARFPLFFVEHAQGLQCEEARARLKYAVYTSKH